MPVSSIQPLSRCVACKKEVYPSAVTKVIAITGSPQHVALLYECEHCGNASKVVSERSDWADRQNEVTQQKSRAKIYQIELDAISSAQDLMELWASYPQPPIREEVMNACGCITCKRRLYV